MQHLTEKLPRPDDMKPDAYQRNIAARAFDVARYMLFFGIPTGVGQVTSIRTLERQIRRLKSSQYAEVRELGRRNRRGLRRCRPLAPGTRRRRRAARAYTRAPCGNGPTRAAIARGSENMGARELVVQPSAVDSVDLLGPLTCSPRSLPRCSTPSPICRSAISMNSPAPGSAQRNEVIDVALRSRTRRDELLRGFRGGLYAYDIVMDIGAYRDMHRHRRCQQYRQAYSGRLGFDTPQALTEAGIARYYGAMDEALDTMQQLPEPARALPAAIRRALALPVQDGFRRSRIYRPAPQRRQGPLQLSPGRLGDEAEDGATGARTRPPHGSHAALGRRPIKEIGRRSSQKDRWKIR